MSILDYWFMNVVLWIDTQRLNVRHYFLRRRIKNLVERKGFELTNFEIVPPGASRPDEVNIWPKDDTLDHQRLGRHCVCRPDIADMVSDNGNIFTRITHREWDRQF